VLEEVLGAPIEAEAAAGVLLGLVEDDMVIDPGLGPPRLVAVEAEDRGRGVGVARRQRLGLPAQAPPCAPHQVRERPPADLELAPSASGEGRVEAGGERAEDLAVRALLGLLEDPLEGAPRPPLEGGAGDHLQEGVAGEGAVIGPEGEDDFMEASPIRQRDLGARVLQGLHPFDAQVGLLLP
jgi:hypothetical protein